MTDRQSTHGHDCWAWGPKHYECAVAEIERLREALKDIRSLISIDVTMHFDPFDLIDKLGDAYLIADAALGQGRGEP